MNGTVICKAFCDHTASWLDVSASLGVPPGALKLASYIFKRESSFLIKASVSSADWDPLQSFETLPYSHSPHDSVGGGGPVIKTQSVSNQTLDGGEEQDFCATVTHVRLY